MNMRSDAVLSMFFVGVYFLGNAIDPQTQFLKDYPWFSYAMSGYWFINMAIVAVRGAP